MGAAASKVHACWVALLSIMSIIRGPIFISAVSLLVAIFASAMSCYVRYLLLARCRGPVLLILWPVSSYVATTLFRRRAPASTAATGPLASLVGAVALAARPGAVMVDLIN
jgi:hypothetical protein